MPTAPTAERPRRDGRGVESHTTAQRRGRTDAVIAGLLFMGGLRRSEVSALEWRDVADATDGEGVLVTVRTSKTNQEGDTADVRYLKNGTAQAIRTVRAAAPPTSSSRSASARRPFSWNSRRDSVRNELTVFLFPALAGFAPNCR